MVYILLLPSVIHLNSMSVFMCITKRQRKLPWENLSFLAGTVVTPLLIAVYQPRVCQPLLQLLEYP